LNLKSFHIFYFLAKSSKNVIFKKKSTWARTIGGVARYAQSVPNKLGFEDSNNG